MRIRKGAVETVDAAIEEERRSRVHSEAGDEILRSSVIDRERNNPGEDIPGN